jgi:hypothetical protein
MALQADIKSASCALCSSRSRWIVILFMLIGVVGAASVTAAEQTSIPDFSGTWVRVNPVTFHPIPGDVLGQPIERLAVDSVDAPEIMAGNYENPILLPWAREIVEHNAESEIRLEHVNTSDDSCWPLGVPQILNLREPVQFFQSDDAVVIIYQRDHQVRRIALNQAHIRDVPYTWYGDSVGHYEGDALVVDTIRQREHKMSVVDNYGTPHTAQIHVVERYRRIEDENGPGVEVRFRVDDPGAFTMPWTGMIVYRPSRNPFGKVICAENNRSFETSSVFGEMPQDRAPVF